MKLFWPSRPIFHQNCPKIPPYDDDWPCSGPPLVHLQGTWVVKYAHSDHFFNPTCQRWPQMSPIRQNHDICVKLIFSQIFQFRFWSCFGPLNQFSPKLPPNYPKIRTSHIVGTHSVHFSGPNLQKLASNEPNLQKSSLSVFQWYWYRCFLGLDPLKIFLLGLELLGKKSILH